MPRHRSRLWPRAAAVALLGLIGLLADARPALAMGCHAPDRPVLGLGPSIGPEADAPTTGTVALPSTPMALVVPRSCPGEQPGLTPVDPAPQPPAAVAGRVEADPPSSPRFHPSGSPLAPPCPRHEALERPPRSAAPTA